MKTKLTLILLLSTGFAFAQIQKGTWMIGGSAGLNSFRNNTATSKNTNTFVSPQIGYFFANRWGVGSQFGLQYARNNGFNFSSEPTQRISKTLQVENYLRYYLSVNKWNFFVQQSFSYKNQDIKSIPNSGKLQRKTLQAKVGVGSTIFLSPNIALEGRLQCIWYENVNEDFPDIELFPWVLNLNIGIQLFLNQNDQERTKQNLRDYYFRKGNYHLSGLFNMNYEKRNFSSLNTYTPFTMTIHPDLSYFLTDYWKINGLFHYQRSTFNHHTIQGIGFGTSYYFHIWKGLYLEPAFSFYFNRTKQTFVRENFFSSPENVTFIEKSKQLSGGLNLHYFVSSQVLLHAACHLEHTFLVDVPLGSVFVNPEFTDANTRNGAWSFGLEYFIQPEVSVLLSYRSSRYDNDLLDDELSLKNWQNISSGISVGFNYLIINDKK